MVAVKYKFYRGNLANLHRIFDRWKLIDLDGKPWLYWRGNNATFGFKQGMLSNMCLTSPLFNMLWNFKYRNYELVIPTRKDSHLEVINGGKT